MKIPALEPFFNLKNRPPLRSFPVKFAKLSRIFFHMTEATLSENT